MSRTNDCVCGRCGATPATLFHCDSGTGPAISICDDCLAADFPWQTLAEPSAGESGIPAGICDYCGGSPAPGKPDTLSMLKGLPARMRWMCPGCSDKYDAFIAPKIRELLQRMPASTPMEAFTRIEQEMEAHMRRHTAPGHN